MVALAGLPEPEWGAEIPTAAGTFLVDALWRSHGVAVEVDGAAFHLSAEDWTRDPVRQNALLARDSCCCGTPCAGCGQPLTSADGRSAPPSESFDDGFRARATP